MVQVIKIASTLQSVYEVEHFLNAVFKDLGFSRKIYCKIYLAVTEAVNNAVIHGNGKDKTKFVSINFHNYNDHFIVQIEDEGKGFDYTIVPDPRDPNNIRKESGRGIFIMKQYADKVNFEKQGSIVQLTFNK